MHAILESPVITVDAEAENALTPGLEAAEDQLCLPSASKDAEEFYSGEGLTDLPIGAIMGDLAESPVPESPSFPSSPPALPNAPTEAWPQANAETAADLLPGLPGEFDALYHTFERRVYRQCLRMLGNAEDAEDLTQEVFLQIYRKADTFRGEASFSTWVHRLTVNTVLMQIRRQRRWRTDVTSLDSPSGPDRDTGEVPAIVGTLAARAENPLDKVSLDVALAQLSSGYKEVFLLHDLEGYRHDEIANRLGITEGTSKSQLHKARLRMRDLMGGRSTRDGGRRITGMAPRPACQAPLARESGAV